MKKQINTYQVDVRNLDTQDHECRFEIELFDEVDVSEHLRSFMRSDVMSQLSDSLEEMGDEMIYRNFKMEVGSSFENWGTKVINLKGSYEDLENYRFWEFNYALTVQVIKRNSVDV